tara:strand:+ start:812 stop:1606 length:795 start_codon:yes stop_codon:yes gene_type:complete
MDPIRNIPNIQVYNVGVYRIPNWQIRQPYVPNFNPVTNYIGFPVVDMPGCVKAHKDNQYHKNKRPVDKSLVENDPGKIMTLCPDGSYPTFSAMDYQSDECYSNCPDMVFVKPKGNDESRGDVAPPEADTSDIPTDPPCPAPNQPRIGSLGPNEKEKVSGYELQPDPVRPGKKICVVLYEDIGPVEQFLPSPQVASTTAAIATVAGASALLAKPLAEILTRTFKPVIKQVLTKVNAILGKSPSKPHRSDLRANEYRKKKGLPPLK